MRILLATIFTMMLPQSPTPLVQFRNKARPVLIFTPSVIDRRFLTQIHQLEPHTGDLAERQVVVLAFPAQPGPWPRPASADVWPQDTPDGSRTRTIYRVAPADFMVILVGKDGGEKLRSHQPIPYNTLSSTIDAMPMRQGEMRPR